MKSFKKIIIFSLLIHVHLLNSQNEFSKWYFGAGAGLDFSTSPPTVLTNANTILQGAGEGYATISDNSGNLLFYTDGFTIYNSAHLPMANGSGFSTNNRGVCIVQQPGQQNLYYVFMTRPNSWLIYSIVDMSLAGGLGSVTVNSTQLYQPGSEHLSAVRHCNGKDVWILTHDFNTNQFRALLLNSAGLSASPVLSSVGPTPMGSSSSSAGLFKISPNGKLLAMSQFSNSVPSSSGLSGFYLFDFDPGTGVVSNSLQLNQTNAAFGVEFSPDGKKLYGSVVPLSVSPIGYLFQWDLCAGSNSAIVASQYSLAVGSTTTFLTGALQKAIDGKIYLAGTPTSTAPTYSVSVINNPNASGAAMNFVVNGQSTGPKKPRNSFPGFINPYVRPVIGPLTSTVACQQVNFAAPTPTFAGGCAVNAYPINSYLWDFGEVASGSANTSTLANPAHTYSAVGSYSVKLILYSNCTNDTLLKTITITSLTPVVSVSGYSTICRGDKRTYTASGASTYSWSNSASGATVALSPTVTTVYTMTGTINGCKASNTFTVNVGDCVGISSIDKASQMRVYPNPFTNELSIEVEETADVLIIDLSGRIVTTTKIQKGVNNINTGNLKSGLYIVQCSTGGNVSWFRVVKSE